MARQNFLPIAIPAPFPVRLLSCTSVPGKAASPVSEAPRENELDEPPSPLHPTFSFRGGGDLRSGNGKAQPWVTQSPDQTLVSNGDPCNGSPGDTGRGGAQTSGKDCQALQNSIHSPCLPVSQMSGLC